MNNVYRKRGLMFEDILIDPSVLKKNKVEKQIEIKENKDESESLTNELVESLAHLNNVERGIKEKEEIEPDIVKENGVEEFLKRYYGVKMKEDENKAKKICLKCSKKGELIAKGFKYFNGWDVERNFEKSFNFFHSFYLLYPSYKFSRKLEMGYCLYMLGMMYEDGLTVEVNYEKAKFFYEKAIELENTAAMNALAYFYQEGIKVKEGTNFEKAMRLFERASDLGDNDAKFNLGVMYYKGIYVKEDYERAFLFFQTSKENGIKNSICYLAFMYFKGHGVEKDVLKGIELYESAANLGITSSMIELCQIYEIGIEISQNHEKAVFYYLKLITSHSEEEQESLFFFEKKLRDILTMKKVNWIPQLHPYWNSSLVLNNKILLLLLISKFRKSSSILCSFLVKGVSFKIIKFLCHSYQTL